MVAAIEPGLYSLIARSNSPNAVSFQRWIFEDVLPSIRRTGNYSLAASHSVDLLPHLAGVWRMFTLGWRKTLFWQGFEVA